MTVDRYDNWIGGAWQAGGGEAPNLNPSDPSDRVGRYAVEFYTQVKTAYIAAGAP